MKNFKEGMLFCGEGMFSAVHLSKLMKQFRVRAVFSRHWSKEKGGQLDPGGGGRLEIYLDDVTAVWMEGYTLREVSRVFKKLGFTKTQGAPPNHLKGKHVWTNRPFIWCPRHIDVPHPSRG